MPSDAPVIHADSELAALLRDLDPNQPVALAGGDLCRTLGGKGDVATRLGTQTQLLPIDVMSAQLDDNEPQHFVAHLVARGMLWRGPTLVVMNADVLGQWRPAPRAHPGDGLLDALQGSLSGRQRLLARRRLRTGDHLPHPGLSVSRGTELTWQSESPRRVELDGVFVGRHRTVSVQVMEHFLRVAV